MGSKSHDIYNLQITPICDQETDLFRKNLVQLSAYSKNGTDIFKGLLKNSQRPVNLKVFERLGFTSEVIMTKEMLTDKAVFNFIKNQVDNSATKINDWFFIPYNYLNVIEQLKNNNDLTLDYTDTETFIFKVNGNNESIELPSVNCDNKTYYVMKQKIEKDNSEIPAISSAFFDEDIDKPMHYIMLSEEKNAIYVENEETYASLKKIEYLPDERVSLRIKYSNKENKECIWDGFDNITREATATKVLGIIIKDNGNIKQENKKMHIALSNLGIKYEDIKDSLNSDTLKTFFITYATKDKNYHFFSKYLNSMYRENNNITINIGGNVFKYSCTSHTKTGYTLVEYALTINTSDGEKVKYEQGSSEFFYFIPLNWVEELTLKERYQFIKECLVAIAYNHDVIHTKWYESGFFRFALMVATMLFTGNPVLVISMTIVSEIVISTNLAPELKQAILIVTAIVANSYSNGFTEPSLTISDIANISAKLGEFYFKSKTEDVSLQIKEYLEKEKQLEKTIQKIKKQNIFLPMEQINSYYDIQYDLLYNFNDLYYNTVNEPIINDRNLI